MECYKEYNKCGNVLISDQFNNRVIEINGRGEIVWSYGLGPTVFTSLSIIGVNDAQRIGKYTMMVGTGNAGGIIPEAPSPVLDNRVIIVDKCGNIVWQYGQFGLSGTAFNLLNVPVQATYIPCCKEKHKHCDTFKLRGTVLITDQGNNRVIRVNKHQNIVWEFPGPNVLPGDQLVSPNSAQYLECGNVLIADEGNNRAIEVDKNHNVIKVFTANGTLGNCSFASRLCNGNTLLTDATNSRIVEVDQYDNIVWQFYTNSSYNTIPLPKPSRGLRLENGNTIISDQFNNRVIVINETYTIMAYYGLPLSGGNVVIGTNSGDDLNTTQLGLYCPHDAKVIGDYTGITSP